MWQVVQALPFGVPRSEPVGWGDRVHGLLGSQIVLLTGDGWPRPLVEDPGTAAITAGLARRAVNTALVGDPAERD